MSATFSTSCFPAPSAQGFSVFCPLLSSRWSSPVQGSWPLSCLPQLPMGPLHCGGCLVGPSLLSLPHESLVAQASREKLCPEPVSILLALPLRHVSQCPWPPAATRKEAAPHTKVLREESPPKAAQAPQGAGQEQQGMYVPGQKLRLMEPHTSSRDHCFLPSPFPVRQTCQFSQFG